ncbi:MAG TPA: 23S rRNA (guanosine(2251)-2'-O)-methyltransferase RlmB [Bacilli bacterium]|mgnify:FL=1|nr:23S rRNA methyltransferase [Mycoplasma sp. CAG:611]HJJ08063.1 23S rRNA (guanosine(2251)-2'-O)-methyltransferase RlmB [Bacilli bacterium]
MLVYGKNSCEEILKQEKNIKRVYLERNFKDRVITDLIEKLKIKPIFLTKYELDDLCEGNHQGIVIEALEYEYADIDEIINENGFIVMLDHLEDTHNFGAIIRTCEAAGVDGIIIPKDRSVSVNSTVMKTSSGAAVNVKICMVTNLVQTINYLKEKGYWIYASSMDGTNYTNEDYKTSTCIIIGNEGKGVSELVKKSADFIVSIPMIGKINSLNASVAAGIFIYEVVRQRSN